MTIDTAHQSLVEAVAAGADQDTIDAAYLALGDAYLERDRAALTAEVEHHAALTAAAQAMANGLDLTPYLLAVGCTRLEWERALALVRK